MSVERIERRLYLDIDGTLIDTKQIKKKFIGRLADFCSVTVADIENLLNAYVELIGESTKFDPKGFAEYISQQLLDDNKKPKFKAADLANQLLDPANIIDTAFPDVSTLSHVVRSFFTHGLRLGVFSQGVTYWQQLKLLHSGVPYSLFEPDLEKIHPRKTDQSIVTKMPGGSVIVDDREDMLAPLAERADLHPIWINRKSQEKSSIPGVETIHTLRDLSRLLRRLWLGEQPTKGEQSR